MFTYPETLMELAKQRQQELIAEADQHRLLTAARKALRGRKPQADQASARGSHRAALAR